MKKNIFIVMYRFSNDVYSTHENGTEAGKRLRLLNAIAGFKRFVLTRKQGN